MATGYKRWQPLEKVRLVKRVRVLRVALAQSVQERGSTGRKV